MKRILPYSLIVVLAFAANAAAQPGPEPGPEPAPPQEAPAYESLQSGNITVKYMAGWQKPAQELAEKYDKAMKTASAEMGFTVNTPIELTVTMVKSGEQIPVSPRGFDPQQNIIRWPIFVAVSPEQFTVDAPEVQNELLSLSFLAGQVGLYNVNQGLITQPDVSWFFTGYCLYYAAETMTALCGDKYVKPMFGDGWLGAAKDMIFTTKPEQGRFRQEYQIAMYQFFAELYKNYGKESYAKILDEIKKLPAVNTAAVIKAIDAATGGDSLKFCKEYVCKTKYPFLGVQNSADWAKPGVQIVKVFEGGAAADAGLKDGDVIIEMNGKPVNSIRDLQAVLNEAGVGGQLKMVVERDGAKKEFAATLKAREFKIEGAVAPQPQPQPQPGQPGPQTPLPPESRERLKSVGFTDDQIAVFTKLFEPYAPGEKHQMPDPPAMQEILSSFTDAGFSVEQMIALLQTFKLHPSIKTLE